jgi:hypothetical protein
MTTSEQPSGLKPLKVTCTSADCENELHCFKFHSRNMKEENRGHCRYCGVDLVDWERIGKQNIHDVDHTLAALRYEFIRHHFWHKAIDEKAQLHARRKGVSKLREAAQQRILSSVGGSTPFRDGQQTPMDGNILYYAQHATASCCRSCIEYWYDIPKGRELTAEEVLYFVELVMRFVAERMPQLPDEPEKISRKRNGTSSL